MREPEIQHDGTKYLIGQSTPCNVVDWRQTAWETAPWTPWTGDNAVLMNDAWLRHVCLFVFPEKLSTLSRQQQREKVLPQHHQQHQKQQQQRQHGLLSVWLKLAALMTPWRPWCEVSTLPTPSLSMVSTVLQWPVVSCLSGLSRVIWVAVLGKGISRVAALIWM